MWLDFDLGEMKEEEGQDKKVVKDENDNKDEIEVWIFEKLSNA